jgi:outer membrane protein assembly factor BamB
MKYIVMLSGLIAISGCDVSLSGKARDSFARFETSKGNVYLLNTATGTSKTISTTESMSKLSIRKIYEAEDGKIYEYEGSGKLKELTTQEAADKIIGE